MKILRWIALAAFAMLPVPVLAQGSGPDVHPAVFCQGLYALCIKAPCAPVIDKNGNITSFTCSCDVKPGWSMGPGDCDSRVPFVKNGYTFMTSTYSNYYNKTNLTMTCNTDTARPTPWAWCYGAPCMVDPVDPTKAACTCPVGKSNPMQTLGGTCGTTGGGCNGFWSAANSADDNYANVHFYEYMKQNHADYPANPPAAMCAAPKRG